MNMPTIFNPQYSADLRKAGNACISLADSIDKFSGAPSIPVVTARTPMAEATKSKIRAAHRKRAKAKVQEIGKAA